MRPTEEWLNQPGGLAERLARLRKSAGLTGDQLASQLGWSRSRVPKLENGRQMPVEADITAWAQACGRPRAADELLVMLTEAQSVHRQYRHQLRRGGHAAVQRDLGKLVRQATRIRNFETMIIPGLLQTPGYARCRLAESMRLSGDQGDVEEAVAARVERQAILYESGREFEFTVMETALLIRNCPDDVLLGQLDRLMGIAGLANMTFGIIPLSARLAVTPVIASFLLLDDITYIQTYTSEDLLRGTESAAYSRIADELRTEAVTGDEARRLIVEASARLRDRGRT